ncbi:MAG: DNA methyltransferase [Gallionellales bacterium RBG_16_57_15]|nr:MAG: DNA methyltransferase [Gallionellales bacterium RBG_16_57_15]
MTPQQFIAKWQGCQLAERAFYQQHFNDLCALVGHSTPAAQDTIGDTFCFEKGASKTGGGNGWADVWKRGFFAVEYKGPTGDLRKALDQVQRYALALENPPLLVVARADLIEIHTNFTNTVSDTHTIALEEIGTPENLAKLRALFFEPEQLRPARTTRALTEQAAKLFASLANTLRDRGHAPQQVAHFLDKLLFCFFAEDAGLLPKEMVTRILENGAKDPARIDRQLKQLFASMSKGGDFGAEIIDWFNGGLFDTDATLPLQSDDIAALITVSRLDWTGVEPSIFGTLFERGLDPSKRSQLGAHYTDPQSIMRIVEPVVIEPLNAEWENVKAVIEQGMASYAAGGKGSKKGIESAQAAYQGFMQRLSDFRVLDPTCGSGNFLYLALHALKDIEHRATLEAEALRLPLGFTGFHTGPHNVLGIELNTYAAELARVTVWIGELQWMLRHGMSPSKNPILKPLNHIACRDAILNEDGSEAQWPKADCIIGNPPFLGGTKKRGELGNAYFEALAQVYGEQVPPGADLVCYWFQKAQEQIENGHCYRAGLVATNSIRQQANRKVLDQIVKNGRIFEAWSDEPWINEGAAVRVSIICFGAVNVTQMPTEMKVKLDGCLVTEIHANLRSGDNLTTAVRLPENEDASFFGLALAGSFSIEQEQALEWLSLPNPNGRPSSDVVRPLWNGQDLTGRWDERWVVDFGPTMSEDIAMLYEAPFQNVLKYVKPVRILNNRKSRAEKWWRHGEARPAMRKALSGLGRYIATSEKSKHRFFVWLNEQIAPDNRLVVIARNDDATFGVLSSRIHVCWALAVGSTLEDRPAYATTTCFETFPFPEGMTPNLESANYTNPAAAEIAAAAQKLNELRDNWLNPPEWVDWLLTPEEEKAGYPARPVAKLGFEADLKKRTLTNLYNARPAWLDNAHKTLDAAVAKAYGWNDYMPEMADEEILRRLLALNLNRSAN